MDPDPSFLTVLWNADIASVSKPLNLAGTDPNMNFSQTVTVFLQEAHIDVEPDALQLHSVFSK
jgi:hypothetical protein